VSSQKVFIILPASLGDKEIIMPEIETHAIPVMAVIIPMFNSMKFLPKLVASLKNADLDKCEVIFVDDFSSDGSAGFVAENGFRVISMPKNSGPAAARNFGMKMTASPLVLFADSDIIVKTREAFQAVVEAFTRYPQATVVTTISEPLPENPGFLPSFVALNEYRCYAPLIAGKREMMDWPEISTRFGAFRREVIDAVGGFDETIPVASVEDADLAYRLIERKHYGVMLAWLQIGHHWPDRWWPLIRAWVIRSFLWCRLSSSRSKINVGHVITLRETCSKLMDCVAWLFLSCSAIHYLFFLTGCLLEAIAIAFKLDIYRCFRKYHPFKYAFAALFVSQVNSVALALGIVASIAVKGWSKLRLRTC
jgi:glycosyltransferase involved in cell wall biosynthesis